MQKFKITSQNHFKHLFVILYYLIIIFGGTLYFSYSRNGYINYKLAGLLALCVFILLILPQIILHLNYYSVNKNGTISIDIANGSIFYKNKKENIVIEFNDVIAIDRYKSFPMAERRMYWFPWDAYNFTVINTVDGNKLTITSLVIPNIDPLLVILSNKIKLHKVFYKIAPYSKLQ